MAEVLKEKFGDKENIKESQVKRAITNQINSKVKELRSRSAIPGFPKKYPKVIMTKYESEIADAINTIFIDLPLTETAKQRLHDLLGEVFYREVMKPDLLSGIVIMGLGENDVYPGCHEFMARGIAADSFWFKERRKAQIHNNVSAWVVPFAQSEMVYTFMEGIDPKLEEFMIGTFSRLLENYIDGVTEALPSAMEKEKEKFRKSILQVCEAQIEQLRQGIEEYRRMRHVDPIIEMIAALPKEELAKVAESLVNLTSFKRRVSTEAETVAEPIDVAVISRGDGFVWIKRKHYFPPELNPAWVNRYLEE